MEVAVERPQPAKEDKKAGDVATGEMATAIGGAPPIVFESFPSTQRDPIIKKDEKLEATKAEMGEVREENERLKTLLSHIVRDYKSLQMHFLDVVKVKEQAADGKLPAPPPSAAAGDAPDDLVSLSLGTRPNGGGGAARGKPGHKRSASASSGTEADNHDGAGEQLSLGLSCASGGSSGRTSNSGDVKQVSSLPPPTAPLLHLSSESSGDDAAACPPASKPCKSSSGGGAADAAGDEEVLEQQAKKARVSVRVKCDTPTMNDGCQWRKYGQKISKGNPCPRAYYRCTVAPSCPVRKQVQRCVDDMSILITTYEGTHSHPLPPAAAAMASTTSAAASMLMAGPSSSSAPHHGHLVGGAALLGGQTTISTATSCPTVTLDLTAPPPYSGAAAGSYESRALPAAWSSGYLAYGVGSQAPYYGAAGKSSAAPAMGHFGALGMAARPAAAVEQLLYGGQSSPYQMLQRPGGGGHGAVAPAAAVTDTIAKAITSDPSFQSVLAAAITSYMGRGGSK